MTITECHIKLVPDNSDRLLAYCSIVFDGCFVVRDLKVIDGDTGIFVSMPTRKITDRCLHCSCKNYLKARFCNRCGHRLDENRTQRDEHGNVKLHADIAHPITRACRDTISDTIIKELRAEQELAKLPGYRCLYDERQQPISDAHLATV